MNTITNSERRALIAAAKASITLDNHGEIVGGFAPAWQSFQAAHNISQQRARGYIAKAARLLRGEQLRQPGRPELSAAEPTERVTITLSASDLAAAKTLGNGNVSAGVRAALDAALSH